MPIANRIFMGEVCEFPASTVSCNTNRWVGQVVIVHEKLPAKPHFFVKGIIFNSNRYYDTGAIHRILAGTCGICCVFPVSCANNESVSQFRKRHFVAPRYLGPKC